LAEVYSREILKWSADCLNPPLVKRLPALRVGTLARRSNRSVIPLLNRLTIGLRYPNLSRMNRPLCLLCTVAILVAFRSPAADWPQWRGPERNGISPEKSILAQWPAEGPKILWKASVGTGFSSMSVADGRVYTMGNKEDRDTVWCFEAGTGKEIWKHTYTSDLGPKYYEGGPGSTPTVHEGRVYSISKWGDVFCLDAATGKVIWQHDLRKERDVKPNEWGFAGSALVYHDLIIFNAGAIGTAFDRETGKIVWANGTQVTGYASPKLVRLNGKEAVLIFGEKHLFAVEPKSGHELWRFPWETSYNNSNPDPIILGETILLSTYNRGAALLSVKEDKPTVIYKTDELNQHLSPGVLLGEYLYTFTGQATHASDFICFHVPTGKVKWHEKGMGTGSVIAADNNLIIFSEKGELVLAEASPNAFKSLGKAHILGGRCWTSPALANGLLYVRNAKGDLACVDLRKPGN
jgi:outer membrane protein assembly factor BamB